ncbi:MULTISPECIES: membrane protein insertion efficiency factor YidD [Rhizobium]|uniref:membrane protein insertion efficiency factor YidD n=1 Tax=Rhizobium TaxID=379 RepID=UPI0007EB8E1C|nr:MULTISPECIES: membrane protein insertion efficiency factor YidD [Rhizobium]ANK91756.1 hemolytic domain-containing protein [Rhizobium sp. N6212]ANK97790.1 hemolytic domain-containing protein [Rhizobium sp. N621]ANL03869.1 hemolytic domain-containing protein [Rhizobium esperanzae]ANL09915.1 hemolytic domain-containing protein [Rhizobium sp. N1341]ANL21967.1 hemolytic domain-containing protein [Rhizobium sp. N113]
MCEFCVRQADDEDDGGAAASRQPHAKTARYSRNYTGAFRKTPDRLLGMGLLRLYQLTLSGFVGNSCRHIPTCSEYGYEAIARHGLWAGGWMTLFRVGRCCPGGTSGLDQVPETLGNDFHWWTPWRYLVLGRKRG